MRFRTSHVSNSSVDSFICQTNFTLSQTTDILNKMLNFYNDLFGTSLKFKDVFETPRLGTERCYELHKDYRDHIQRKEVIGKVVIQGQTDNSIPYVLFGLIEEKFNSDQIHLG